MIERSNPPGCCFQFSAQTYFPLLGQDKFPLGVEYIFESKFPLVVRIGLAARACGSGNGQSPSSSVTVVDRTTRLAEAIPVQSTTAQVVADSFVANWVARFGVPAPITTDQGTQFTGGTWQCMCKALGSKHVRTTAYHP